MKISPTVWFSAHPSFFLGMTGNHLLENKTDRQCDTTDRIFTFISHEGCKTKHNAGY